MKICSKEFNITLGDRLPTTYDVAIHIFSICSSPGSKKMQGCIRAYSQALILKWTEAFGEEHVLSKKQVKLNLLAVVNNYHSKVYKEQTRRKSKNKDASFVKKSLSQLNKEWKQSTIKKGRHKTSTVYINKLFDIGKNMDSLTGDKACFYTDQLSSHCGHINKDDNFKNAAEKQTELELAQKPGMTEESKFSDNDVKPSVSSSNGSRLNKSSC